jgi:3-oxoacyl-[acyl-carrier-protein] synthase II
MTRRVVVTGLGMVSPVGSTVPEAWSNIVNGVSGIESIDKWKEMLWAGESVRVTIGGFAKSFNAEHYIEPIKNIRRMDRFLQFAIAAGRQAWEHAGLPRLLESEQSERAGAITGVGLIGPSWLLETYDNFCLKGPKRVSPFLIPSIISNLAPSYLAIRYNLRNANWSCVSACASSSNAIGEAFMHIQSGRADLMLAGGAESAMHPLAVAGFDAMGILCRSRNAEPQSAVRPFERDRDGFVLGEGAGMVVLEELESAKKRGAIILAEMIGYGSTHDAHHITAPAKDAAGAARAMRDALEMGSVSPEQVGYINANGTATRYNDKAETDAIKEVFGSHAYKLMVSSTKSMTGHLLGAAGGVEAVFCVLSLTRKLIPPTINLDNADPECDLDYVAHRAREHRVDVVMSNSFGLGGANSVLLFKRF